MRGIEFDRLVVVGFVPPLQGGECFFWTVTWGFTPGYHMSGFQPYDGGALIGESVGHSSSSNA